MRCPYCELASERRAIHRHLVEHHPGELETGLDASRQQLYYCVRCRECDFALRKTVRPRSTDPAFLDEFRAEIALVAFDLLLYHAEAAHATTEDEAVPSTSILHIPMLQE